VYLFGPARTPVRRAAASRAVVVVTARRGSGGRGRVGTQRWLLASLLACAACHATAQQAQPTQPPVSLEYAVQATDLYKLAPFVNWPPDEFATADAPFQICVAGADPFDDFLDKAVAGRSMGAHPFAVRRLQSVSGADGCQILFISRLTGMSTEEALAAVSGKPVLTVTDSTPEGAGGIVHFVIDQGRVAFEIDTDAAARNRLTISSKLLQLAVAIKAAP
jgi:hypothetical protein